MKYTYVDNGKVDETTYVTVLDEGSNPIEYEIPLTEAQLRYPGITSDDYYNKPVGEGKD